MFVLAVLIAKTLFITASDSVYTLDMLVAVQK
jgi:hypothetical protein